MAHCFDLTLKIALQLAWFCSSLDDSFNGWWGLEHAIFGTDIVFNVPRFWVALVPEVFSFLHSFWWIMPACLMELRSQRYPAMWSYRRTLFLIKFDSRWKQWRGSLQWWRWCNVCELITPLSVGWLTGDSWLHERIQTGNWKYWFALTRIKKPSYWRWFTGSAG